MDKVAFYIEAPGLSSCAVPEDVCHSAYSTRPNLRISLQMSSCDCFLPSDTQRCHKTFSVACSNVKHIIMSKMKTSLLDTLLFTCFTMWISSCVNYAGIANCLFIWSMCVFYMYTVRLLGPL